MTEATIDKLLISGLAPTRALAPESDEKNKAALVEQPSNKK